MPLAPGPPNPIIPPPKGGILGFGRRRAIGAGGAFRAAGGALRLLVLRLAGGAFLAI